VLPVVYQLKTCTGQVLGSRRPSLKECITRPKRRRISVVLTKVSAILLPKSHRLTCTIVTSRLGRSLNELLFRLSHPESSLLQQKIIKINLSIWHLLLKDLNSTKAYSWVRRELISRCLPEKNRLQEADRWFNHWWILRNLLGFKTVWGS